MLLWFHNPDYYDTANIADYWDESGGALGGDIGVRADGYLGRAALTGVAGYGWVRQYAIKPSVFPGAAFRAGARFLFEQWPGVPNDIIKVVDPTGTPLLQATLNTDGTLSIYRGASEVKAGNTVLSLNTHYRIGFRVDPRVVNGTAEVQLNRTVIIQFTGRTSSSDTPVWAGVEFGCPEDSAVNHMYLMDSYGHQPDLIPGLLVKSAVPIASGTFQDWAAPSGTVAEATDDTVPDDATTEALTSIEDGRMTLQMAAFANSPTMYAIQTTARVRSIAYTPHRLWHVMERNGALYSDYDPRFRQLESDWAVSRQMWWFRTDDGEQWSDATINERRFGVQVLPP